MSWTQTRARLAGRSRSLPPGHPELEDLKRLLRFERLEEHVEHILDGWPPLRDDQLDSIVGLLHAARTTE
jgi:hypothetical protein